MCLSFNTLSHFCFVTLNSWITGQKSDQIPFFYDSIYVYLRDRIFIFRWIRRNVWISFTSCHRKHDPLCYTRFYRENRVVGTSAFGSILGSLWLSISGDINRLYLTPISQLLEKHLLFTYYSLIGFGPHSQGVIQRALISVNFCNDIVNDLYSLVHRYKSVATIQRNYLNYFEVIFPQIKAKNGRFCYLTGHREKKWSLRIVLHWSREKEEELSSDPDLSTLIRAWKEGESGAKIRQV